MRNSVTVQDQESIKPFSVTLVFVCAISGAFQLVGSMQDRNSTVQSNKGDWCVKFKQPVEGRERVRLSESEIKKEKAEDLNGPPITFMP